MDTKLARRTSPLDDKLDPGCASPTVGGRQSTGRAGIRTDLELRREVAALTAQVEAQAAETAALRQELTELRSSLARELLTQKIVLVDQHQSTTIKPGSVWLRHDGLDAGDDGSPRPGSDLGIAAMDTWTGILCSIEGAGLPQLSADLVATVEQELSAGVVCHCADVTREFAVADGDTP